MRRKTILRLSEYDERGDLIREVSVSGSPHAIIDEFVLDLVRPALLAWGYQPQNVDQVLNNDA
jgi:hypothetical protein